MHKVTSVATDWSRHTTIAQPGESAMAAAVRNGVPGTMVEHLDRLVVGTPVRQP